DEQNVLRAGRLARNVEEPLVDAVVKRLAAPGEVRKPGANLARDRIATAQHQCRDLQARAERALIAVCKQMIVRVKHDTSLRVRALNQGKEVRNAVYVNDLASPGADVAGDRPCIVRVVEPRQAVRPLGPKKAELV